MIATDENALICDFAETYHIYDFRLLPVKRAAILAAGLRRNSRIHMQRNGMEYPLESMMLASMADSLAFIAWSKTQAAQENRNRPKSILNQMLRKEPKKEELMVFESGEDFKKMRQRIIEGRK